MLLCTSPLPLSPPSLPSTQARITPSSSPTNKPQPVCPSCSNVLTVSAIILPDSNDSTPTNRLECQTCPYEYVLTKRYYERKVFTRKEREDVFGGPGAWDNAQKAHMQCPREGCDGEEAAFFQVQIRSADEPMTGFYKVCFGFLLALNEGNVGRGMAFWDGC